MFRVMVVDDEPIAAQSVVYMIEKNFTDVETAAVCSSGKEAIEKAALIHPDIVIMDIDMPGINGLTAMRQIQEAGVNTAFIVVTAFDYFDYAVEAMTLGVAEYLVKPVKEAKLVSVLTGVLEGLRQKRSERMRVLEQQERLEMAIPMLEEGFHNALRLSQESGEDLIRYCKLLGFRNMGGFVLVAEFLDAADNHLEPEKRRDAASNLMKRAGSCIVGPWRHGRVAAYYFDDAEQEPSGQKDNAIRIAQTILRGLRQEHGRVFIGIGRHYESVVEARRSYQQARRALQIAAGEGANKNLVLHVDDVVENNLRHSVYYRQQLEEALFVRVEENDSRAMQATLERLFLRAQSETQALPALKDSMTDLVLSFGRRYDIPVEACRTTLNELSQAEDEERLFFLMREYMEQSLAAIEGARKSAIQNIIDKANRYIRAHYAEQLSLDDVAREVNLSSFYFSRLYKRETGVNFSDKLAQVRIERAKELLNKEDLSVKEIAYLVGYQEPNYFSRIFKKLTGRTASEYKKEP